jgi:hypothetical protein
MFHFTRTVEHHGSEVVAHLRYDYADGRPAVQETVTYEGGHLDRYVERNLQNGSHGELQVERNGKNLRVDYAFTPAGPRARARHKVERFVGDHASVLVDDQLVPFILRHWSSLSDGASVPFQYVVLSRTETVAFALRRVGEIHWHGVPAVDIAMAPTGLLTSLLVKPVHFILEKDGRHHLLEYQGRTLPKIERSGSWRNLDAVTIFHWMTPRLASSDSSRRSDAAELIRDGRSGRNAAGAAMRREAGKL